MYLTIYTSRLPLPTGVSSAAESEAWRILYDDHKMTLRDAKEAVCVLMAQRPAIRSVRIFAGRRALGRLAFETEKPAPAG